MKCKYKDIKAVFDWFEKFGGAKEKELIGKQPGVYEEAYYIPSGANWAYIMGLVIYDNIPYKVITIFGEVRAVMPANIPSYDKEWGRK